MSLRGVHIVFITVSFLLAVCFAYFEWLAFQQGSARVDCIVAVGSTLCSLALLVYGIWFVKKSGRRSIL